MAVETRQGVDVAGEPVGVRRTLRRIQPGSVLKFCALFSLTFALVVLLAGGILYFILSATGFVGSVQSTIQNAGYPRFRLEIGRVFEILAALTLVGAVAWTVVSVLAAVIFNLVAEAVGGIEVTLKE
ncbi:MAG TPA: DUF3566 domain-containing protein [Actinomycetota bacterium]|nr:DUF3566 domain-containing protein [Actinomycetota bacterium]